jgi:hypothetical protein
MKLDYALLSLSFVRALDAALPHPHQQPLNTGEAADWFSSDEFDAFVKSTLSTWHVPGFSIAVVDGEKISAKVPEPKPFVI